MNLPLILKTKFIIVGIELWLPLWVDLFTLPPHTSILPALCPTFLSFSPMSCLMWCNSSVLQHVLLILCLSSCSKMFLAVWLRVSFRLLMSPCNPAPFRHVSNTQNPLLKKNNLDPLVFENYRPKSNLPFLGKILEKVAYLQLHKYLSDNYYVSVWLQSKP